MSTNLEAKKAIVSEIKKHIQEANSVIFVDYKGIKVSEDTALRTEFTKNDCGYKVYKNRLMLRALKELNISGFDEKNFEGATAVAYSKDEVQPAKIFCKTMKSINKMDVKFGLLNGKIINKNEILSLSKIPPKEILIATLLGGLNAPIAALARALNEIAKKA